MLYDMLTTNIMGQTQLDRAIILTATVAGFLAALIGGLLVSYRSNIARFIRGHVPQIFLFFLGLIFFYAIYVLIP